MTDWIKNLTEKFKISLKDHPLYNEQTAVNKDRDPTKKECVKTEENTSNEIKNTPQSKEDNKQSVQAEAVFNLLNGKMPNGKDCLGCKITATVAPLGICIYLIQTYRKQNWKAMSVTSYRLFHKAVYGSCFTTCLVLSVLSATGAWLAPKSDESIQDYLQRDQENQRQIRGKMWTYMKKFSAKSE